MTTALAETILRAIGFFYAATSLLVIRTLAVSAVADTTWAAIMGEPSHPAARRREIWLAAGALVIGAGGLALLLLLDLALPLFVLGALQQAVYLAHAAPRWFDPHDEPDTDGRRRTVNAAFVHAGATLAVAAAAWGGLLRPWTAEPLWLTGGAAAIVAAVVLWTLRALARPRG